MIVVAPARKPASTRPAAPQLRHTGRDGRQGPPERSHLVVPANGPGRSTRQDSAPQRPQGPGSSEGRAATTAVSQGPRPDSDLTASSGGAQPGRANLPCLPGLVLPFAHDGGSSDAQVAGARAPSVSSSSSGRGRVGSARDPFRRWPAGGTSTCWVGRVRCRPCLWPDVQGPPLDVGGRVLGAIRQGWRRHRRCARASPTGTTCPHAVGRDDDRPLGTGWRRPTPR